VQENQEQDQRPDPTAKRFAEEHRRFLEENRPHVLAGLRESGSLTSYLSSVGETASQRLEHAQSQHLSDPEVQKLPFQERVRELQNRQQSEEEVIRHDLIHQPTED
jgi:transposon-encoded protein TnpV